MKRIKALFWTSLTSLGVITLSIIPIPEVEPLEDVPLIDKWVHFVMYGAVAMAVWHDRCHRPLAPSELPRGPRPDRATMLLATLYPAALGGLMELVQAYLTTYRSGDWLDFVADCVGVALAFPVGYVLYSLLYKLKKSKSPTDLA